MTTKNNVVNFKVAKYFQSPKYFEWMRDGMTSLMSSEKEALYDLTMWLLICEPGKRPVILGKNNLTLAQYKKELTWMKENIIDKMPKECIEECLDDYRRYG